MNKPARYLSVIDGPFAGDAWDQLPGSQFTFRNSGPLHIDRAGPHPSFTLAEAELWLEQNKGRPPKMALYVVDTRDDIEGFYFVCDANNELMNDLLGIDDQNLWLPWLKARAEKLGL